MKPINTPEQEAHELILSQCKELNKSVNKLIKELKDTKKQLTK